MGADPTDPPGDASDSAPADPLGDASDSAPADPLGDASDSAPADPLGQASDSLDAARPEPTDLDAVRRQLGRPPRAVASVAHRCPCGLPDVVRTLPRLPDGTPFPTLYYLTCPRAVSMVGTLEAFGLMREMNDRLAGDAELAAVYRAAHERYLTQRERLMHVPEIAGVSAGGMPTRVKCLHVLVGQALAEGPGVQPLGDAALARLDRWWADGPCVDPGSE